MLNHHNETPIKPNRVVIMGCKGFIGSTVMRNLEHSNISSLGISKEQLDLREERSSEKLLKFFNPNDALVILSAIAPCKSNDGLIDNIKMLREVCTAIVKYITEKGILSHIVYISSDAVYADDVSLATEDSILQPGSLHGMMHAARELMIKSTASTYKIPLAILRPSLLYGLDDPHNAYGPNRFRRLAAENKNITLFGEGEEKRDHIYIEDVAEIIKLCLLHRTEGYLNIVTGQSHSFREIAEMVVNVMDNKVLIQGTPRQNPITHRFYDIAACHKAFPKFYFTTFKEGILKVLESEKAKNAVHSSNLLPTEIVN